MYYYEMHCHTWETSKCGKTGGANQAEFYHKLGFDGIIVTDHFLNGNCLVPKTGPWKDRIDLFLKGYRAAKKRGDELGIKVFLGWEASCHGTDFLTYGLGEDWLYAHEDCDIMPIREYCDMVRADGGIIVQAHPFREASYIDMIRLMPRSCDGVEVLNARRTDFENARAEEYAANYELTRFCGSDNHSGMQEKVAAMVLPEPANSVDEILDAIFAGKHKIEVIYPEMPAEK